MNLMITMMTKSIVINGIIPLESMSIFSSFTSKHPTVVEKSPCELMVSITEEKSGQEYFFGN